MAVALFGFEVAGWSSSGSAVETKRWKFKLPEMPILLQVLPLLGMDDVFPGVKENLLILEDPWFLLWLPKFLT